MCKLSEKMKKILGNIRVFQGRQNYLAQRNKLNVFKLSVLLPLFRVFVVFPDVLPLAVGCTDTHEPSQSTSLLTLNVSFILVFPDWLMWICTFIFKIILRVFHILRTLYIFYNINKANWQIIDFENYYPISIYFIQTILYFLGIKYIIPLEAR